MNMNDEYLVLDKETNKYIIDPEQAVRDDVEKHKFKLAFEAVIKDWRLYVMLIPMLFVFFCWRYLPMYELLESFKVTEGSSQNSLSYWCGFANYKELMFTGATTTTNWFWRAFRNTFILSFYGLCFGFPMPIIVALFFNEIKSNVARSVYQVLTYLPKFMSTVIMTSLVIMLVKQGDATAASQGVRTAGIVSKLLTNLGIISEDAEIYGLLRAPKYFRAIYIVSGIWEGAGYDSIVYFAAIIAISPTSYEAAQIDGAGKMAQMRYVVIPSILSTLVIMLINRIGSLLSIGYEKVYLLYSSDIYETADVVSTMSIRLGIDGTSDALGMAAEMLNNVTGMILVIGANTIARKASDVSLY